MTSQRSEMSLNLFLLFILAYLIPGALSECGSLLTYRQHAALLETAPQCLRNGCNQGQNTTISSPCPSTAPCSAYWSMFVSEFDQKHSWCSTCGSDKACRIHGWPVMNATEFCDTTPNMLLFGGEGCCIENDEPFELADWTGRFCNGSEWRQPFDPYGGMARLDWLEWIMPWNWTVRNDLLPPDQQKCTAPSKYLAIYVGEHFFWVLFGIAFGTLRLWRAKLDEKYERNIVRYYGLRPWTYFKKIVFVQRGEKIKKEGEHIAPTTTQKLRWGFPVIVGIILAGLQVGFNFLAAWFIQKQPGYHDTPIPLLALLFCCRPRLSWVCGIVYALLSKKRLAKIFGMREEGDGRWAAKLVLSSVAVSSAVTEALMQLLGAYFLIKTAHVGQQRGFYKLHALRPKFHGRDARHMYLGALFWAMIFLPMLAFWFIIAYFQSRVNHIITGWRRSIFDALNPRARNLPQFPKVPVDWMLNHINPDSHDSQRLPTPPVQQTGGPWFGNQDMPSDTDQPLLVQDAPYDQPIPVPYGGPGSGDFFSNDQIMPIRQRSNPRRTSPYAPIAQSENDDQIMPVSAYRATSATYRAPSGGYYAPGNTGPQRRTPSGNQYSSLPQVDGHDEVDDQVIPVPERNHRQPEMTQVGARFGSGSYQSLLPIPDYVPPPESSGSGSTPRRSDITDVATWSWKNWEKKIIFAGAVFGMVAYASQWLFWDGFVKAAGDRFCPPKVVDVGAFWWAGSLLYVGLPFMGY